MFHAYDFDDYARSLWSVVGKIHMLILMLALKLPLNANFNAGITRRCLTNEQNHERSSFHRNNRRATARMDCLHQMSFQAFVFAHVTINR